MSGRRLALVVEDTPDQVVLLRRILDREGFDVHVARDGESAIAALDEIEPALAMIDLQLPGISGRECARLVQERFPECFLVVSSVLDATDYPPADAALPKPITSAALRGVIERMPR